MIRLYGRERLPDLIQINLRQIVPAREGVRQAPCESRQRGRRHPGYANTARYTAKPATHKATEPSRCKPEWAIANR